MKTINDTVDYSQLFSEARSQESKNSREQEFKRARNQEVKTAREWVDSTGRKRRPVNLTMYDDTKLAIDILAARRRVRASVIIEEALHEYLGNCNTNSSRLKE